MGQYKSKNFGKKWWKKPKKCWNIKKWLQSSRLFYDFKDRGYWGWLTRIVREKIEGIFLRTLFLSESKEKKGKNRCRKTDYQDFNDTVHKHSVTNAAFEGNLGRTNS